MDASCIYFFIFFCGIVVYWVSNNILSIAQQWYITRKIEQSSWTCSDTIVAIASGVGGGRCFTYLRSKLFVIGKHLFENKPEEFFFSPATSLLISILQKSKNWQRSCSIFPGPNPTGEDVVEVQAHGSLFVLQEILSSAIKFGAD